MELLKFMVGMYDEAIDLGKSEAAVDILHEMFRVIKEELQRC